MIGLRAAVLLAALVIPAVAAELVVFCPGAASAVAVERTLLADPALGGSPVVVAIKWRAFVEAVQAHPQAVVVAPGSLLLDPRWQPQRQGRRAGSISRCQSLVAVAHSPDLAGGSVGVAQGFPRERAAAWLAGAFPGLPPSATVRLVARPDDLVQALGLDLVRAVVVAEEQEAALRTRFPAAVTVMARSLPLRLPIVAVGESVPAERAAVADHLAAETLAMLEVDGFVPFEGPPTPWIAAR